MKSANALSAHFLAVTLLLGASAAAPRETTYSSPVTPPEPAVETTCEDLAADEVAAKAALCEDRRGSAAGVDRCKRKVKSRYDEAVATCVAARKAGTPQMDFLDLPKDPPPKEPPPKEPAPK